MRGWAILIQGARINLVTEVRLDLNAASLSVQAQRVVVSVRVHVGVIKLGTCVNKHLVSNRQLPTRDTRNLLSIF